MRPLVRPVVAADAAAWRRMRQALWPEDGDGGHAKEIEEFLAGRLKMPLAVLVAVDEADAPIGFVELFIRTYAEDCETDRVAYSRAGTSSPRSGGWVSAAR